MEIVVSIFYDYDVNYYNYKEITNRGGQTLICCYLHRMQRLLLEIAMVLYST